MKKRFTDERGSNENKTAFVVVFSAVTMLLEVAVGIFSNSMALLADGIHMGSHVMAIGLSWGAYVLARRLTKGNNSGIDRDKLLSLAAFSSGILLLVFALFITAEATERFFTETVKIRYVEAIIVAATGMAVNIICAFVLHDKNSHGDYNRHSAYLHVLADALTSLGAIVGLICAMIWNIIWIDTAVAFICSIVIIRWALKLLKDTGIILVTGDYGKGGNDCGSYNGSVHIH